MMRFYILSAVFFLMSIEAFTQEKKLKPDFAVVQYGGSIGLVNVGVGYDIFKDNARVSLHYGYVPKSKGGKLNIFAAKFLFHTSTFKLSEKVQFEPLAAGLMVSYHFGSQFKSRWPDYRYPDGYYWWRTSLRAHVNIQSSMNFIIDRKKLKSITCYIDLNTNDLYLVSYVQNHSSLKLSEIIKAGYGIRVNF
jgi:hypothetical protein